MAQPPHRARFFFSAIPVTVGVLLLCGALRAAFPEGAPRPNIVLILADDLGFGDLGCYGQKLIHTPNLDRMAAEGTRFTSAYAGAPVCAPSRCSLMTGLHTGHARVRGNSRHVTPAVYLQPEDITVAEVLKSAGYRTAHIGKWGLGMIDEQASGLPERQGFDHAFGYLNHSHAHNSYPSFLWRGETKVPLPNSVPDEWPVGAGVSDNKALYAQDLFMDEVFSFLRSQQDGNQPFFLYFSPTIPHANNEAKPLGLEIPDLGEYKDRDWTPAHKAFAAMVARLDSDVGRILDFLSDSGLDKNTLVIFTSDNGPHQEAGADPAFFRSSGPLRGIKRDLYEGGIRVPMIVRWPGHVPAGRVDNSPWYFPDILPTLAHLARTEVPGKVDGVSIMPLLMGQRQPELQDRLLYWEFHERRKPQAVRQGDWKAVRPDAQGATELYFLPTDPGETSNLASQHPDILARLLTAFRTERIVSPLWPFPTDDVSIQP